MKKIVNKIVLLTGLFVLIFAISNTSKAVQYPNIPGANVKTEGDLAGYIASHPKDFINLPVSNLLGKFVETRGGAIDHSPNNAQCMYHALSSEAISLGSNETDYSEICTVIDIDGTKGVKVNGTPKVVSGFEGKMAGLINVMEDAEKMPTHGEWYGPDQKYYQQSKAKDELESYWNGCNFNEWFGVDERFYKNDTHNFTGTTTYKGKKEATLTKVDTSLKLIEANGTSNGSSTEVRIENDDGTISSEGYVGPLRVKYSNLKSLGPMELTYDGSTSTVTEYYVRNGNSFVAKPISELHSDSDFYVKVPNGDPYSSHSFKLTLKAKGDGGGASGKKARIVLLCNIHKQDQQLLLHAVVGGNDTSTGDGGDDVDLEVTWEQNFGPSETEFVFRKLDSDGATPLAGVEFKIWRWVYVYDDKQTTAHSGDYTCPTIDTSGDHWVSGYYDSNNNWVSGYTCHHHKPLHGTNATTWNTYEYKATRHKFYLNSNGEWDDPANAATFTSNSKGYVIIRKKLELQTRHNVIKERTSGGCSCFPTDYKDYKDYIDPNESEPGVFAEEKGNPYYGYDTVESDTEKYNLDRSTSVEGNSKPANVLNPQKYIKLSGFVWLDSSTGKDSTRDNLFEEGEEGFGATGANKVKVSLKDSSGNVVIGHVGEHYTDRKECTTYTGEYGIYDEIDGGEYQFEGVDLDALKNHEYHIEFEYCGLLYQSVTPNIDSDYGSKADDTNRAELDAKFASVQGTGGQSINAGGVTVNYNDVSNYVSTLNHSGAVTECTGDQVIASTDKTGYDLSSKYSPTLEEIKYINFGVYEKAQTDYALSNDLYNVKVTVNNKSHIYKYNKVRPKDDDSVWNDIGVKWQTRKGTYTRAIYKADYEYETQDSHKNEEINVQLTYIIGLKNQSSYNGMINSVVDFADDRCTFAGIGRTIDDSTSTLGSSDGMTSSGPSSSRCRRI